MKNFIRTKKVCTIISTKLSSIIYIIIMFLLSVNMASAITLDELIDSYDFNYKSPEININFDKIVENNLSLNLYLNITAKNKEYIFSSTLISENTNTKLKKILKENLSFNSKPIKIEFEKKYLENEDYILTLEIFDKNNLVYKNFNFVEIGFEENSEITKLENYNYTQSEDKGILKLELNNIPKNTSNIFVNLVDKNNIIYSSNITYETEETTIFEFDSQNLIKNNIEKLKLKEIIFLRNNNPIIIISPDIQIINNLSKFEITSTQIQSISNISKIDSNNNGKYNKLEFKINIYAKELGNYKLNLQLIDEFKIKKIEISKEIELNEGNNEIIIEIESEEIYENQILGNLIFNTINLFDKNQNLIDNKVNFYTINNIDYQNFQHPPTTNLEISNIKYNKTTGNSNIILKNLGNSDAIRFTLKIIDKNFNTLNERIINYLIENQSLNLTYNFKTNMSEFYAYIDYYNEIKEINENNNILYWPVYKGEICGDGIDNDNNDLIDENCNTTCPKTTYPSNYWIRVWCDMNLNQTLNITDKINTTTINHNWNKENLINNTKDKVGFIATRTIKFDNNTYTFSISAKDNVKLYLDNKIIIDKWDKKNVNTLFSQFYNLTGEHIFKIKYSHNINNAFINFNISTKCPTNYDKKDNSCIEKVKKSSRKKINEEIQEIKPENKKTEFKITTIIDKNRTITNYTNLHSKTILNKEEFKEIKNISTNFFKKIFDFLKYLLSFLQ